MEMENGNGKTDKRQDNLGKCKCKMQNANGFTAKPEAAAWATWA